jgi:hypothetical protein
MSSRFCRWRRLGAEHALLIAEWVTKPSPAQQILLMLRNSWKEIVFHPESGGLADILLGVVPALAAGILCTCVTLGSHIYSRWS